MDYEFPNRTIYYGDNLGYLRRMPKECIDSICIDPPFNSNRDYSTYSDSKKQWEWNDNRRKELEMLLELSPKSYNFLKDLDKSDKTKRSYLVFMALRLCEMRRILMSHGTLFLICDNKELHYLKVLLDMIFGDKNEINSICYRRDSGRKGKHNEDNLRKSLSKNSGYILVYSKDKNCFDFDMTIGYREASKEEITKRFNKRDDNGKDCRFSSIEGYKNAKDYSLWN